jgi:hypothetical protein
MSVCAQTRARHVLTVKPCNPPQRRQNPTPAPSNPISFSFSPLFWFVFWFERWFHPFFDRRDPPDENVDYPKPIDFIE